MKNHLLLLFLAVTVIMLTESCRSMGRIRGQVYMPPIVKVPDHIREVGVVNRTTPQGNKGKQVLNTIEGILSGEGLREDKNGAIACMSGAEVHLNMDTFARAEVLDSIAFEGSAGAVMSSPLDWELLEKVAETYNKDAILVLEVFDTDQQNSTTDQVVDQAIGAVLSGGKVTPRIPQGGNARVLVKMAWRLYDVKERRILDQVRMNDYYRVFNRSGNFIYDMGEFGKRDAIAQSAFVAGRAYCTRLFPSWVNLYRDYYIRGSKELKMARRMAQLADMDGAAEVWRALALDPRRKVAGRACFNMAVACEMAGDLDGAIEWIKKAYTLHNLRRARDYANLLNNRKQAQIRLEQQAD